ncbi:MAG: hypothetical protein WBX15_07945 [Thermoanaerobaculia bacterium]
MLTKRYALWLVAIGIVLGSVVGCQNSSGEASNSTTGTTSALESEPGTGPTETATASFTAANETMGTNPAAGATTAVTLTSYRIDIPSTLPPGERTFVVKNASNIVHGFEIDGQGIQAGVDTIQPGNTARVEANLENGTYRVYCPVDQHVQKGMESQLQVQ